ncbi:MAG TPA: RecQ family zinc-binding domain-containing protein, partial [Chitinophagaceae bacterium]
RDIEELKELHTVRYPSFEQIRGVYQALANFLQIPVNIGEDCSYDFHFDEFVKNFKLSPQEALYALKALESDGWLAFNERAFSPPTVVFTTSKKQLYEFQRFYPQYEELLTTLLRTYEGIFDYPSFVNEVFLARLLRREESAIKQQLKEVSAFHIIDYTPLNDQPQVLFLKNRVAAADLGMNLELYNKRKAVFIGRVEKMLQYIATVECRSQFINEYFGDAATPPCGICNNCLSKRTTDLTPEEFERIAASITARLAKAPLHVHELIRQLEGIHKEKARRVLDFLQAEQKVWVNDRGQVAITH